MEVRGLGWCPPSMVHDSGTHTLLRLDLCIHLFSSLVLPVPSGKSLSGRGCGERRRLCLKRGEGQRHTGLGPPEADSAGTPV